MATDARERMIDGTVRLLAQRGLQATSFSEVLELTGAPRGSVYHHFPGGKDQLVRAAVEQAGGNALAVLDARSGATAEEITEYFLDMWRLVLSRSDFHAGCAVLAVTVEADSAELLDQASQVFRAWVYKLTELYAQGGLATDDAHAFATMLVASSEGAVVLSRSQRSMDPFELVAAQLTAQVRLLSALEPVTNSSAG